MPCVAIHANASPPCPPGTAPTSPRRVSCWSGREEAGPPAQERSESERREFDSLFDAVKATQADLGRFRGALERIGMLVSEVLAG